MYTIKITYKCPQDNVADLKVLPISGSYEPTGSYTESAAYDGTVYDTNVRGWGSINLPEPYASTSFPFPVPMAQFKLATVGKDVIGDDGKPTGEKFVEFKTADYKEAFYYKDCGASMAGQGFTVEVTEDTSATTENTSTSA